VTDDRFDDWQPPMDGDWEPDYAPDPIAAPLALVGEIMPRAGSVAASLSFKQKPMIDVHREKPVLNAETGKMEVDETRALHQTSVIKAFAVTHMGFLRYDSDKGKWFAFTGAKWSPTDVASHVRMFLDRMKIGFDAAQRKEMTRIAFAEGVERGASTEPGIGTKSSMWDRDPNIIATPAGVIDLRTGEMRDTDRADLIQKSTAVSTTVRNRQTGEIEQPDCPTWKRCLGEWFRNDAEAIAFVQRFAGYCLTAEIKEQKFLYLWGNGGNGKSLLAETLTHAMGDYAKRMAIETITETKNPRHMAELAVLQSARLVVASEPPNGFRFNTSRIKTLTGDGSITADLKFRDPVEFDVTFKLLITANPAPTFSDCSEAMKRRLVAIEMPPIAPERRDDDLGGKLREEAPGILRWAVEGAAEWHRTGLRVPARIVEESRAHVETGDVIAQWIDERCLRSGTARGRELWTDWSSWAKLNGHYEMSATLLGTALTERGFKRHRTASANGLAGISLRGGTY
jgi:putative DNA primase/helicase